ncbi:MAG TPA: SRPBCC family protein [Candidatus Acidoferrum sp.]|nr:SRPBCC family protein [Candidatus Acidoferrum sp.]
MKGRGNLTITTPSDREIAMTRVFEAPRELVYQAYTRPELVKRWLGVFGGWSLAVCEIDLRVGGSYRHVWRGPDGREMGMRGVYREIVPAERIVATETFDQPWYEGEAVGTVIFVEQRGKTTLTTTVLYASRDVRDGVLRSPMEEGVAAGYDKLAELLPSLAQGSPSSTR